MRKLYYAKQVFDVVFVSEEEENDELEEEAQHYISEQNKYFSPEIELKEVLSLEDLPEAWKSNALIWGTKKDEDLTVKQFLAQNLTASQEEYQEYLRLKAIYEK